MVDCARERYANADTAAAVRFLETVLVPKVTAAYLDTMCASYMGSRDPRVKLSFFKGQPTHLIEEVTRKITDELIEKSIVDVGFPPLDDSLPTWFVDQYVWPLAIRRTRPYVCIFVWWQQALHDLMNLGDEQQPLQFSHYLQPSKDFLDGLRVDHGKLVDDVDGDFNSRTMAMKNWPSAETPFSLTHRHYARSQPLTYGHSSERGDPKPVFRAVGLLWHEFFLRLDSDPELEQDFDQKDFSERAERLQQEWLLRSFTGVSPIAYRNYGDIPQALHVQLRQNFPNVMNDPTQSHATRPQIAVGEAEHRGRIEGIVKGVEKRKPDTDENEEREGGKGEKQEAEADEAASEEAESEALKTKNAVPTATITPDEPTEQGKVRVHATL
jgi:hypothetical protein